MKNTLLKEKGKRRKEKDHAGHKVRKPLSHFSITLLKEKAEPTPNRVQSTDAGVSVKISLLNLCRATRKKTRLSLLKLPRCDLRSLMSVSE